MSGSSADVKKQLTAAFNAVDKDHSGSIDSAEVEAVLKSYYTSAKKPCDAGKIKTEAQVIVTIIYFY